MAAWACSSRVFFLGLRGGCTKCVVERLSQSKKAPAENGQAYAEDNTANS